MLNKLSVKYAFLFFRIKWSSLLYFPFRVSIWESFRKDQKQSHNTNTHYAYYFPLFWQNHAGYSSLYSLVESSNTLGKSWEVGNMSKKWVELKADTISHLYWIWIQRVKYVVIFSFFWKSSFQGKIRLVLVDIFSLSY